MTLGAAVYTFINPMTKLGVSYWNLSNPLSSFNAQSVIPSWFVVVFLIFCIIQLFAINSLDLYSSGVTLQAIGVHVKRYQAVIIDSAICLFVTIYAILNSSFSTYLKDFVDVVIVWIAPWMAIYLVDWALRRWRYVPSELQNTRAGGLYWYQGGVNWAAIVAQLVGMVAALEGLNPTFNVPSWMNKLSALTGSNSFVRADFSIYLGIGVGGLLYLVLAWGAVRRQADKQRELLSAQGLL
jgi:purine-cytosine permease-like protein